MSRTGYARLSNEFWRNTTCSEPFPDGTTREMIYESGVRAGYKIAMQTQYERGYNTGFKDAIRLIASDIGEGD